MTGGQVLAALFALAGLLAAATGAGVYVDGRLKSFYRRLWKVGRWSYGPSATIAMIPIGLAMFLSGVALLAGGSAATFVLFFAALGVAALGAVVYITDPRWLSPRWARFQSSR